jgi:hypothetical protein
MFTEHHIPVLVAPHLYDTQEANLLHVTLSTTESEATTLAEWLLMHVDDGVLRDIVRYWRDFADGIVVNT